MATYDNDLRLKEITTGDEDGTWGVSTNTNLALIADGFSLGTKQMAADANETFTMPDATADATRSLYLKITSAVSLTATREVTLGPNTVSKTWIIENATSGSQIITIKQGSGATVNVPNGSKVMVVTDGAGAGAAVFNANPTEVGGTVTSIDVSGGTTGLTTSGGPVTTSGTITLAGTLAVANGGTGSTTAAGALINFGLTATAAELNYTDGVTSNIQTQLDTKAPTASPTFTGTVTIPAATVTGDVSFGDSDKAIFGAGNDLQIYHDGSHSYVSDAGAGQLRLKGDTVAITNQLNTEYLALFNEDSDVKLYYNAALKLATTATGIDVTGTATMDGLTVNSGASSTTVNFGNSGTPYAFWYNDTNGVSIISADAGNTGVASRLQFNVGGVQALRIQEGGDIFFYEDTGTTAKLTWSAANESLTFGTNLAITTNEIDVATGDLTLDVAGDIILDAAGTQVILKKAGTQFGEFLTSSTPDHLYIKSSIQDKDIIFGGNDGGSAITALTLDMSAAGAATFNSNVILPDNSYFLFGDTTSGIQGNSSSDFIKFYTANTERLLIAGNGDISFYEDTGTTPKFFWDASAERLGIGTSSPSATLEVGALTSGSTGNAVINHEGGSTPALQVKTRTNRSVLQISDNDTTGYLSAENGLFSIGRTAGLSANNINIDSSNNVGIGESNPVAKIHIQGSGTSGQVTSSLILENSSSGTAGLQITGTAGSSHLDFMYGGGPSTGTNTLTTGMSMTLEGSGAGNVGIGTSSPDSKIHLNDGALHIQQTDGSDTWFSLGANNDNYITTGASGITVFRAVGTERMRIDTSGNLLVGTTDLAPAVSNSEVGVALSGSLGYVAASRSAGASGFFNRLSDGAIVNFNKDGTTVGSIGNNTDFYIASQDGTGVRFSATQVLPCSETGAIQNGSRDLGSSSGRFKDLYLSGGVYLGGTGAANKLDDYEEGTWTPTIYGGTTAGTTPAGTFAGNYTKIGRQVTVMFSCANITLSGAAGSLNLGGLPFTAQNPNNREASGIVRMYNQDLAAPSDGYFIPLYNLADNATAGTFLQVSDNAAWSTVSVDNSSTLYFEGTITYFT
jgi:hypothetical protein